MIENSVGLTQLQETGVHMLIHIAFTLTSTRVGVFNSFLCIMEGSENAIPSIGGRESERHN